MKKLLIGLILCLMGSTAFATPQGRTDFTVMPTVQGSPMILYSTSEALKNTALGTFELTTAHNTSVNTAMATVELSANKNIANGYASLDALAKIPTSESYSNSALYVPYVNATQAVTMGAYSIYVPTIAATADSTSAIKITSSGGTAEATFDTINHKMIFSRPNLLLTSSDCIALINPTLTTTTDASAGAQASPVLTFGSHRFTSDTLVDQSSLWKIYAYGGVGVASGNASLLRFNHSQSGAADVAAMTLAPSGLLTVQNATISAAITNTGTITNQLTLATTSTNGFLLTEPTVSSAGTPVRMTPRIKFTGHAWNTTPTAADNTINFIEEVLPTSGLTTGGSLDWSFDNNGGGYTKLMRLGSNGNLCIGTTTADATAILDLPSTTKVFLPPRMTTTQMLAVTPVVQGSHIFNTTVSKECVYTGTTWEAVTSVPF